MASIATIQGIVRAANRDVPGATVYLIPASAFASPPTPNSTIPTSQAIATTVTDQNGMYLFTNQPQQEYWAAVAFAGLTAFDYHNVSSLGVGASGQITVNAGNNGVLPPLDIQVNGISQFHVGLAPSGTTHYCSGSAGLNGPWDFFHRTATPPAALKVAQTPLNQNTASSGAFTWLNVNDRWGIGHLDVNNIVDPAPDYPIPGYTTGGNSLVFFDLLQNTIPHWVDSAGETHFTHNNPSSGGTSINFTLSRKGPTPYQIDSTYNVGWRTQLADNSGAGFDGMYMFNVVDDPSHPPSTSINLQNVVSGNHVVAYVITKWGASVFPVDPTLAGSNRAVVSVGDGFQPNPVLWSGSVHGTMLGIASKANFAGNMVDITANQLHILTMTPNGQIVSTATDAASAGISYNLQLSKNLTAGTPAVGIANGIQFFLPNSAGTLTERGTIQHVMENVTPGSETSHFSFTTSANGAEVTPMAVGPLNVAVNNDLHVDTGAIYAQITAPRTATHGTLNLGSGGFLGGGGSNFAGSASGTQIAVNPGSTFVGNMVDCQVAGSSVLKVDYRGNTSIGGQVGGNGSPFTFEHLVTVIPTDANFTALVSGYVAPYLEVQSAVSLSITRNLVLPKVDGATWWIYNNTTGAQSIQAICSSGTGITIGTGKRAQVLCDGTNIIRLSADI